MSLAGGANQNQATQAIEAGKQLAGIIGGGDPLAGALLPSGDPLQAAARDPRWQAWCNQQIEQRVQAQNGWQCLKWAAIGGGVTISLLAIIYFFSKAKKG